MSVVGGSGADRGHVITMTRTPSVRCQAPPPGPPARPPFSCLLLLDLPDPRAFSTAIRSRARSRAGLGHDLAEPEPRSHPAAVPSGSSSNEARPPVSLSLGFGVFVD